MRSFGNWVDGLQGKTLAQLFAALYVSDQWFVASEYLPVKRRAYCKTRGIVLFDRALNGEIIEPIAED